MQHNDGIVNYDVRPSSRNSAFVDDIVLDPPSDEAKQTTRKILRANIVNNVHDADQSVNITIMHQRKKAGSKEWSDASSFSLASLKGGEEIRLHLGAYETQQLYRRLQELYEVGSVGIPRLRRELAVVDKQDTTILKGDDRKLVDLLSDISPETLTRILEQKPDLALALSLSKQHEVRLQAVNEFQHHYDEEDWSEPQWQSFFERNEWILGHGLAYQFLDQVQPQATVGGITMSGTGAQRTDYLLATTATVRFTVLVDIKRPDSELIVDKRYRNKVYELGHELVGGVTQLQSYRRTWTIEGSRQDENREYLDSIGVYTYEPKSILVIGNTKSLQENPNKRSTFEMFRRNLREPEIITFDELLERAQYWIKIGEGQNTS